MCVCVFCFFDTNSLLTAHEFTPDCIRCMAGFSWRKLPDHHDRHRVPGSLQLQRNLIHTPGMFACVCVGRCMRQSVSWAGARALRLFSMRTSPSLDHAALLPLSSPSLPPPSHNHHHYHRYHHHYHQCFCPFHPFLTIVRSTLTVPKPSSTPLRRTRWGMDGSARVHLWTPDRDRHTNARVPTRTRPAPTPPKIIHLHTNPYACAPAPSTHTTGTFTHQDLGSADIVATLRREIDGLRSKLARLNARDKEASVREWGWRWQRRVAVTYFLFT